MNPSKPSKNRTLKKKKDIPPKNPLHIAKQSKSDKNQIHADLISHRSDTSPDKTKLPSTPSHHLMKIKTPRTFIPSATPSIFQPPLTSLPTPLALSLSRPLSLPQIHLSSRFFSSNPVIDPNSDPFPAYKGPELKGRLFNDFQNQSLYSQIPKQTKIPKTNDSTQSKHSTQLTQYDSQYDQDINRKNPPGTKNSPSNEENNAENDEYDDEYDDDEYDNDDDDYDDDGELYNDTYYDPNDPNSYRLIIPNRYTIDDFLLQKTRRLRERIEIDVDQRFRMDGKDETQTADQGRELNVSVFSRLKNWQQKRRLEELSQLDNDDHVNGIDSDLELYGGINLDIYKQVVLEPSGTFIEKVTESRQIPQNYLNKSLPMSPGVPLPLPGVTINQSSPLQQYAMVNSEISRQNSAKVGSSWSQMVSNYNTATKIPDATSAKGFSNQPIENKAAAGAAYLRERLSQRFPEVAKTLLINKNNQNSDQNNARNLTQAQIDEKYPTLAQSLNAVQTNYREGVPSTPKGRLQQYNHVKQEAVYSKSQRQDPRYHQLTLPPSKQSASGYAFCPRDAYEAQMFVVHRIQTDNKLRQSLRDAFKYYTKEMDPITGIEACRHALSIELYLYLKTLEDTGVQLGFENIKGQTDLGSSHSLWDHLKGKDETMSTATVLSLMQQYRTKYLQMVIDDDSGELLSLLEEEWVQLLSCVAELNQEVVRSAYIDKDTAYELLRELFRGVSSGDYLDDFEDQLNCIFIQFAKQRRENWDGNAYNTWKENRLAQLQAVKLHHEANGNIESAKLATRQMKQIELLGDDAEDAEQMNNDIVIDELIGELDISKLKLYINNSLLYHYRQKMYRQYGFENDIGALLMTKALHCIPDLNVVFFYDDIIDSANRCRDLELYNGGKIGNYYNEPGIAHDDDQEEGGYDNDEEYVEAYDQAQQKTGEKMTKKALKEQMLREKLDPDYNENFSAGFKDWFRKKQQEQTQKESQNGQTGRVNSAKNTKYGYQTPINMSDWGRYDKYGLPNVHPPPRSTQQYSSLMNKRQEKSQYFNPKIQHLDQTKQQNEPDDLPHTGVPFQPDFFAPEPRIAQKR